MFYFTYTKSKVFHSVTCECLCPIRSVLQLATNENKEMPNNYYDDAANPKTLLNVNVNER